MTKPSPEDALESYGPLWGDVVRLNAKLELIETWFWDSEARLLLHRHAGPIAEVVRLSVTHDIIMSIARLLDPAASGGARSKKENLSLARLVQEAELDRGADCSGLQEQLSNIREDHQGLAAWRNKRIGHFDLKVGRAERDLTSVPMFIGGETLPQLNPDDIRSAVEGINSLINRVERAYDAATTEWSNWTFPPVNNLLQVLRRAGESHED